MLYSAAYAFCILWFAFLRNSLLFIYLQLFMLACNSIVCFWRYSFLSFFLLHIWWRNPHHLCGDVGEFENIDMHNHFGCDVAKCPHSKHNFWSKCSQCTFSLRPQAHAFEAFQSCFEQSEMVLAFLLFLSLFFSFNSSFFFSFVVCEMMFVSCYGNF